jgi:hypothetical protein
MKASGSEICSMVKVRKNGKILDHYLLEISLKVYAMAMAFGSTKGKNTMVTGPTI